MINNICNTCYSWHICNSTTPSQSKEPLKTYKKPEYPFKCIYADYFEIKGHNYLTIIDRFSNWIMIYHLINWCLGIFTTYSILVKISKDGRPSLLHATFEIFFRHRVLDFHLPRHLSKQFYLSLFLNKDWVFECCKMHLESWGTVISKIGSWWSPGGGSGVKAPEKFWHFYIWRTNKWLKIEGT